MVVKVKKKTKQNFFWLHFDPIVNVLVLSSGVEDKPLQQFLLISLYSVDSILPG